MYRPTLDQITNLFPVWVLLAGIWGWQPALKTKPVEVNPRLR
ncbi:hypothetical protein [Candidatus Synechococcus calcipolaris]|nr:hypothetical protein [Candidatus Synechococcus calcipolaris]